MALAAAACISTAVLHAVQSALSQQDVLESVAQGQDYLIAFRWRTWHAGHKHEYACDNTPAVAIIATLKIMLHIRLVAWAWCSQPDTAQQFCLGGAGYQQV